MNKPKEENKVEEAMMIEEPIKKKKERKVPTKTKARNAIDDDVDDDEYKFEGKRHKGTVNTTKTAKKGEKGKKGGKGGKKGGKGGKKGGKVWIKVTGRAIYMSNNNTL